LHFAVFSTKPPGSHPHGQIAVDKTYKVRSILDESKTSYKIDWEDDSVTGEKYDPTWEPKANANQAAIDDWTRQKKRKRKQSSTSTQGTYSVRLVVRGICGSVSYGIRAGIDRLTTDQQNPVPKSHGKP
jgi:hypothetical protein